MTNRVEQLITSLQESLDDKQPSNVTDDILSIRGFSGAKYKRFANRLLSKEIVKNYLEIGVWNGSTAIAALRGNHSRLNHTVIDDFSQFGGPRQEFVDNWKQLIGGEPNLIDQDCFSFNPIERGISNIDVYFYDGDHQEINQYRALQHYYDSMAETFIFMVDDWSYPIVQNGTYRAINELELKTLHKEEFYSADDSSGWWNGCGIFVLQK